MRKPSRWVLAAAALVTATGCKPLDDTMVAIFGRSMRDSRAFDPYENVMQPPAGSVAFSASNFPAGPGQVNLGDPELESVDVPPFTQADMVPIGTGNAIVAAMQNPFAADDSVVLARGEVLYNRHCVVCHGPQGLGAGARIVDKHPTVAAYNVAGPVVAGYSDQYIYGMIRVGRGLMPAYGFRIPHYDRWTIVTYVRKLQRDQGSMPPLQAAEGEGEN